MRSAFSEQKFSRMFCSFASELVRIFPQNLYRGFVALAVRGSDMKVFASVSDHRPSLYMFQYHIFKLPGLKVNLKFWQMQK